MTAERGDVMQGGSKPKVSIIVLNLNGYEDTRDCLESLRRVQYPNFDVIVVDNGSEDDSFSRLQTEFPDVRLLGSKENLGFSGGNNLGIEEALRHDAAYVLLLNNDTVVDPNFLSHLIQVGESDPRIGILGPKIFYASEPTRIWFAGGYVRYGTGACGHLGLGQLDQDDKFARIVDTPFITGCALLVKSAILRKIGLLDNGLFVYWEDADYCMRAQKAGYRCVFVPMARVWHKISRTCGHESTFSLFLVTRNQLTWTARHIPFPFKPGALAVVFMKKFLRMGLLVFKSRDSAAAVGAGIWAFLLRTDGPPRKGSLPGRRATSVSANI